MNYIVKQFLRDCDEQIEYTSYLEMLPEEIITLIYRFVNDDNIKKLSHPSCLRGFSNHHTNGGTYNLDADHQCIGLDLHCRTSKFLSPENINLPPMSFGELKIDCKKQRLLPLTLNHKGVVFRRTLTAYWKGQGETSFQISYKNNNSSILYEISTLTVNTYKKNPVAVPPANTTTHNPDTFLTCRLLADKSSRMLFTD